MKRNALWFGLVALSLPLAACDDGNSGPEPIDPVVDAAPDPEPDAVIEPVDAAVVDAGEVIDAAPTPDSVSMEASITFSISVS